MSKIFAFKVAVFDLDDTLWDGTKLFEDTKLILSTLKSSGVKLYVASFHTDARGCCKELGIDKYFEDILYGRNKTKLDMIKYILKKNPSVCENETVFFDDNYANVAEIRINTNVHVIHITNTGIKWESIANGRIATIPLLTSKNEITKGVLQGSSMYDLVGYPSYNNKPNILYSNDFNVLDDAELADINVLNDSFHLSDNARFAKALLNV